MAALLLVAGASAQEAIKPISQWPKATTFPNEDKAAAIEHFHKARAYAVGDLFADFTLRCITDPKYRQRVNAEQYDGLLQPMKVFDNLFYVGQMAVSAWAMKTTAGIVLFDAPMAMPITSAAHPGSRKLMAPKPFHRISTGKPWSSFNPGPVLRRPRNGTSPSPTLRP
jgi:hypothetical protein